MKKLAFFSNSIDEGSPARQILERCLAGWPSEGTFRTSPFERVVVYGEDLTEQLEHHRSIPRLSFASSFEDAMEEANGWIMAAGMNAEWTCPETEVEQVLSLSPKESRGWIIGHPAGIASGKLATLFENIADRVQTGTSLPWTWRLPEQDIPPGTKLAEAVALVRGKFPTAEQEGLDTLLALTSHRWGGESGIAKVTRLEGRDVWKAAREQRFSWDLFRAAVSRTNSKMGDATLDGRTQDIVGLGMIPGMAKGTRAWILEHRDGLKTTLITVDGILNDDNIAVRSEDGEIFSAQCYRPPRPNDHQYSRLMDRVVSFLEQGQPACPPERTLLWDRTISLMRRMRQENLMETSWNGPHTSYTMGHSTWKP
jgi:hypothetical protein